jgi:hypothetical protein
VNAPHLTPATVREIMDLAAAIKRDEAFIKHALLDAARAGDCRTVVEIVTLWRTRPSSWVAAMIEESRQPHSSSRRRGRGRS